MYLSTTRNIIVTTTTVRNIRRTSTTSTTTGIRSYIRSCFTSRRTSIEQVHKLHPHHRQQQNRFCSEHSSISLLNPSKNCGNIVHCNRNSRNRSTVFGGENPKSLHQNIGLSVNLNSRKFSRSTFVITEQRLSADVKSRNIFIESLCENYFELIEKNCFCNRHISHRKFSRKSINMGDTGKKRVCIVGSGNWGSAIAKIVGDNVVKYSDVYEDTVKMYVYEEMVDGRKLTEIINEDHENVKYLPGHKLPASIIAVPDVLETAKDADILIFVLPHQFIKHTCKPLVGKMKPGAFGLSLIKGFDVAEGGGIELISSIVTKTLSIPCNVLMGANLAGEIADGKFSETTIGAHDATQGKLLHKLIQTNDFRVVVVKDVETVELCGALKNIVAVGAGFIDGLQLGDNTKAAVIRLGLMEMVRFTQEFFNKDTEISTFLESCGVADLITTCYGGRNRKVSEAFVKTGKTFEELEKVMLNGQRLQGPMTAAEVNVMLKQRGLEDKFPLFTAVHRISINELKPHQLIDGIRNHPEHMRRNQQIIGEMKAKL